MYADVIVDISQEKLDRSFQYRIPEDLQNKIQVGMTVRIPFGKGNRSITGYVIGITSKPTFEPERMKDIAGIETGMETLEAKMISLAWWIRSQYGSTMNQALKTVLPVKSKIKEKQEKIICLDLSQEQALSYLKEAEKKHYKARVRLLEVLLKEGSLPFTRATRELQITGSSLEPLVKAGVVHIETNRIYRGSLAHLDKDKALGTPNREQSQVISGILQEFQGENRPCLLHGVTGSGKTLVYMELISRILEQDRQVIVLLPEIALTYQTLERFCRYFGDQVALIHSRMSPGERYDQMEQAKEGRVKVMVGPRSALFTPFPRLGMIVIDEEHENSYKSETMPRYHAREVAIHRAGTEGAHLVFGSATPSVDSYYKASTGEYALFQIKERYGKRPLPKVEIVDMRQEFSLGNRSAISTPLAKAIEERLDRGEQTILFLNRRGYAGFVSCRSCGYVAKCPHCDVSMSLHRIANGGAQKLVCHYCGYEQPAYEACPSCGSPYIGGFKAGTQQIEKIVRKMFPQSRILRMDADTTRQKEGHTRILESFSKGEADILVGTQMIVKGHDFPRVTLVGVLAADLSLNDSDFRSGERTFQLLTQAVGRAGRGQTPGEALIQTYQPEHYSIQAAAKQDYREFYRQEIAYRSLMNYPPVSCMMAVCGGSEDEALLDQGMNYLKEFILLLDKKKQFLVIGPAMEGIGKIQDVYRRIIYVRHKNLHTLTALKDRLEEYIEINSGFRNINIQFDFHI